MFRPLQLVVSFIFLTVPLVSSAAADIRSDHPRTYTVRQGDTLWDIAARFLEQPWQWPEIWHANPEISNPHLIYPGDVLELVYVDGKPRLKRKTGQTTKLKLSPQVRSDEGAVPPVPLDAIGPFLSHPQVIDAGALEDGAHIIGFPDGNLMGGEGMRAYVHGMENTGAVAFDILRRGKTYYDSATGEALGYLARHVGTASLERGGDPATVRLDATSIEVMRGDRVVARRSAVRPDYFFPRPPAVPVYGQILDAYESLSQVARHHVVLIDRGSADGLAVGDVLLVDNQGGTVRDTYGPLEEQRVYDTVGGVFRQSLIPPEIRLPDERAGNLIVFDVFERMSLGLIMDSRRPIHKGALVHNP
jgi:hypothetical protein